MATEIGKLLRKLRGKKSLRDVAEPAGISHSYLSIIEKGIDPRTKSPLIPSPETLKGLAKSLNYPFEELMKVAGHLDDDHTYEDQAILIDDLELLLNSNQLLKYKGRVLTEEDRKDILNMLNILKK